MKLFYVSALLSVTLESGIPVTDAFVPQGLARAMPSCCQANAGELVPRTTRRMSSTDDDWHAEYDPSKYEERSNDAGYGSDRGSGGATRGRGDSRGDRGGGGRGRGGGREGGGGYQKRKTDLGPNGHDYRLSDDSGANNSKYTEDEIHALLAERLQAKFKRDFSVADRLQVELIDGGVFVHDGMKEWRADGVPYGSFHGDGAGRHTPKEQYSKSPHSGELKGASDELIAKLVLERTKFKMMRQYDKADLVREGLRARFDVLIDDRLKEWSAGGDFGEEHNAQRELHDTFAGRGYLKSASSLSLDAEEEEYIQHHVDARGQAKKDRNFEAADRIRLDLAQRFDVAVNDKVKMWSIGGMFEELDMKMGTPRGAYTRRGGGDLTAEEVEAVSKVLSDRHHAKKQRNFSAADELRDQLYAEWSVKVDDRSKEWRVDTDEYAMARQNDLTAEEVAFVDSNLKRRFELKRANEYENADLIRDGLKERFGVLIDDRTKEWFVDPTLGGAVTAATVVSAAE